MKNKSIGKSKYNPPTTLEIDGKDLPELRDVHVDDVITITVKLKATRITEGGYLGYYCCEDDDCDDCNMDEKRKENKKKVSGSFEVQNMKFVSLDSAEDNSSPESSVASRYNKYIKKGMKPDQAMTLAKKG